MKNSILAFLLICSASFISIASKPLENNNKHNNNKIVSSKSKLSANQLLYNEIKLNGNLNFKVFEIAMNGYENIKPYLSNPNIITIIDFSLPSTEKRMFVIDLRQKKLLFNTIVSHGRNSGDLFATDFSNTHGSHQSSLGFFVTENTYRGRNGYSLVINGLEKDINDQAKARAVVIHGADYCSEKVINSTGRLGRSYGCPALPRALNAPVINTIKEGSMLYIYADDKDYFASSKIFKSFERTILAQKFEAVDRERNSGIM